MPIARELRLHAPPHDAHPRWQLHTWGVIWSAVALLLREMVHIGHADAITEDEWERHTEIPRLELVDNCIASDDREALYASRICTLCYLRVLCTPGASALVVGTCPFAWWAKATGSSLHPAPTIVPW